jgi:hypothetical protein
MPLPPHTWVDKGDFLTASLLNSELYRIAGKVFSPNGIAFHAAKPIYASGQTTNTGLVLSSGGWTKVQDNSGTTNVKADTAAMFGARMDADKNCAAKLTLPYSGGIGGSLGGLALMSVFTPVASGTGTVRAGIGPTGGTGPAATGISTAGNSGNPTCPWAVDIVDIGTSQIGWVLTTQTSPVAGNNSLDASGRSIRTGLHWASVYPANGTAVGTAPTPLATWADNTAITAAFMNGASGIPPMMNLLNMPPLLRTQASGVTSVPTATPTVVGVGTATYDTYGGWSSVNKKYTVPLKGLYFIAGFVPYDDIGTTYTHAGVQINGATNIWGPRNPTTTGQVDCPAKVGIFDLNAGDTVALITEQNSGATQNTSSNSNPLLVMVYLGAIGAPSPLAVLPDITYYWQAGQQPSLTALLNAHLANDLNFLNQKPYFLGFQGTAQAYAINSFFDVTMDTVGGIVHNSAGDPWSGWDSTNKRWVAPVSGWYLCVQESFFAQPNTTTGVAQAGFILSLSGNAAQDQYGIQNIPSTVGNGGAAAIGYYYLRAGDWIEPVAEQTAGTTGLTTSVTGCNSHMEIVWVGE